MPLVSFPGKKDKAALEHYAKFPGDLTGRPATDAEIAFYQTFPNMRGQR